MSEEEKMIKLWNDFDDLGFEYKLIKSFALAILLKTYKEKSYEELYTLLSDVKDSHIKENKVLN